MVLNIVEKNAGSKEQLAVISNQSFIQSSNPSFLQLASRKEPTDNSYIYYDNK